ncbi:nucleotide sugar dehydrogenase [Natronobeatus ordinarius]|uniref:nucleotide sugar dehydrogenase n=1 Tax=Natronobeatus ordinarius TaxID=2963433 RepID=UPI0020CC2F63|nr:nucleotide sugar dehydrogenase [Natronobeatus ordinarius]
MTDTRAERTHRQLYGVEHSDELRESLTSGAIPVAVYGLGKMGLPLAATLAETTGNVVGADVDPAVVDAVNAGESHVKREPGLDELVAETVAEGALTATADPREAAAAGAVHVVIVPTPITDDHEPDYSILDDVVADVATGLEPGDLVIVECTVPPRTAADRVRPALEEASGLERGEFGVAVCPERTSSGRALEDIRGAYPKVVGGVDEESTRAAAILYEALTNAAVIRVSDATTAEAVKVFEGVYRDVNIGLANELARFTDDLEIDVREAIEVANTLPYCDIHEPGPGVGGHCIPFYPYFLIDPFETDAPLLEAARTVNDSMPAFTVAKLREEFAAEGVDLSETSILLLGLTYRPGVEEIRASPSLAIAEQLSGAGATVYGVDPLLDSFETFDLEALALEAVYDSPFDGVVLVTPHEEFQSIRWADLERESGTLVVVDGRDALETEAVAGAGHRVYTLGSDASGGDREDASGGDYGGGRGV